MNILDELCSVPTAPFAEERVVEFVRRFVARRPGLALREDRFGNLLIEMKSKGRGQRWVFTAHMDHPGMVAGKMAGPRTLDARFFGWVETAYVRGAQVRFFDGQGEAKGVVRRAIVDPKSGRDVPARVVVAIDRPVAKGSPGMFDLGPGVRRGGKFYSRVCDDLGGAAACLAMLDNLLRRKPAAPVAVLLTRAEEEGFIGCVAVCEHHTLLKKTDRVIAIECSARQPVARQGDGVIIRVGDRTSIFNSSLTDFLTRQAAELKKRDKKFAYQRALMPGGTCEATVYDIWGYHAASLCVALGNYHNMNRSRKTLGAEYIDIADWENMVKLFVQIARMGHTYEPGHKVVRAKILERYRKMESLLAPN